MRRLIFAATVSAVLLNSATAFAANAAAPNNGDPWEGLNRKFYAFAQGVDRFFLRPAALTYSHVFPSPVRTTLRNLLANAAEPPTIANYLLQARFHRAGVETGHFLLNTTVGLGGIFDIATLAGLDHESTNFGVTLGRWGVGPGPYVYIPIGGPTTVRQLVGAAVGGALDPLYYINYPHKTVVSLGRAVVGGLDLRAEADSSLKSLLADATDPYATIRSAYLQNLQSQVDGGALPAQALPDFDDANPASPAKPSGAAEAAPAPDTTPSTSNPTAPMAEPAPAPEPAPASPPAQTTADSPAQ